MLNNYNNKFEDAENRGRAKMEYLFKNTLTMYKYKETDDLFSPYDFKLTSKQTRRDYYCELKQRQEPYVYNYTDEWYVDKKKIDRLEQLADEDCAIPMFVTITADNIAMFWYATDTTSQTVEKEAGKTTMGDQTKINHQYYVFKKKNAQLKYDLVNKKKIED